MKPLDITKRYDLRKLNNEQLNIFFDWLKENDTNWKLSNMIDFKRSLKNCCLVYDSVFAWCWEFNFSNITCATELFEEPADFKPYALNDEHKKEMLETLKDSSNLLESSYNSMKELKQELTLDDLHKDIKALSNKYRTQGFKIIVMFENL